MNIDNYLGEIRNIDTIRFLELKDELLKIINKDNFNIFIKSALMSSDKKFKLRIYRIIAELNTSEYLGTLIQIFNQEKDADAKLLLTVAIGKAGNKRVITSLLELIKSNNIIMKKKVMLALQLIGKQAIDVLCKIMIENMKINPTFSELISDIIFYIPGKMLDDIKSIINIKSPLIVKILGSIDDQRVIQILIKFLDERNHLLSRAVKDALINLGSKYMDVLTDFLRLNNKEYNFWLPQVIVEFGSEGRERLISLLNNASPDLQFSILKALEYKGDERLKKIYLNILKNGHITVKKVITDKIIESKDSQLVYEVKSLLYEKCDVNAIYYILYILKKTGLSKEIITEYLNGDLNKKIIALNVIADSPDIEDFLTLINMLKDDDMFVYQLAYNALKKIARFTFDNLMEYSMIDNITIRNACLSIIEGMKKDGELLIRERLEKGNPTQKYLAAYLVGELRLLDMKPVLETMCKDGNDWVRKYANLSLVLLDPDRINNLIQKGSEGIDIVVDALKKDIKFLSKILGILDKLPNDVRKRIVDILVNMGKSNGNIIEILNKYKVLSPENVFINNILKQIELERSFG